MQELFDRIEELEEIIENKDLEIEQLKQEIERLHEYYDENYNPKTPYELYGLSEKDFI